MCHYLNFHFPHTTLPLKKSGKGRSWEYSRRRSNWTSCEQHTDGTTCTHVQNGSNCGSFRKLFLHGWQYMVKQRYNMYGNGLQCACVQITFVLLTMCNTWHTDIRTNSSCHLDTLYVNFSNPLSASNRSSLCVAVFLEDTCFSPLCENSPWDLCYT